MSFILDALKKSEIERQRQSEPGLVDAGAVRRRRVLPAWAVLLGVLLGINIAVLLVVLLRTGSPTAQPVPARHAPVSAGADASPHFSPLDPAPVYAPEIPVPAADSAQAANGAAAAASPALPHSAGLAAGAGVGGSPARAPHRPDPVLSDEDLNANNEVLPSINEINLTGEQALPELHLDVHVYATKPAERFVYINMRKYHEGAVLQEGPTVERIRRDGVVLDFHGLRFMLPRQS
jgi:general secretion pathway protein B